MAQRRFQALQFQNDPNIARFVVEGITTGRQLGIGSYGSVEEVEVNGLICAGKKIHEALLDAGNVGVQEIASKYVQECQLMSDLRHPNITLFLGVCFLPNCQLPVLLMERLDGSLDDLLETVPNIPLALKRAVLEDVARGLLYLHKHSPQIVHRDLTAKNVLLTASLVAKITDFGNSRIVNLQHGQLARTLSRLPGTLVYMPPEAISASPRYGPGLDIFSFGHLALFTLTQVFPGDLLEPTYANPNNPEQLIARSEVERRGRFFERLEREQHCCMQLTKDCLHNIPSRRPTAEQLVATLEGMRVDIDDPCGGAVARADAVRQVVMMKAFVETKSTMREQTNELAAKDDVIQRLHLQIQDMERRHHLQTQQKDAEHQQCINEMQEQLQVVEEHLQAELQQKDVDINRLEEQLARCQIQQNETVTPDSELNTGLRVELQIRKAPQVPLSEPRGPLNIEWRNCKNVPYSMTYYPEAVVLGEKVYVGAGISSSFGKNAVVMVYNIPDSEWSMLPEYACYWFGMTSVDNKLVLVGGVIQRSQNRTNQLGTWNEESKNWMQTLPSMPTARSGPTVATYKNRWIMVAGGFDLYNTYHSTVEILDILTGYWHHASPLPERQYKMSSTIIGNMWYLLGGYIPTQSTLCTCVCIDDLIYDAVIETPSVSPWQTLPNTPNSKSTALGLNGALLAVGGKYCSSIYHYKPRHNKWVKVGELPSTRRECACTLLPNGAIFIVGGRDVSSGMQQVDIGSLK